LWFLNKPRHIMLWDSPWGRGYPGWHIECSAMSMKYLGETFDIHCGGVDHIPVHHTNEIAQSECATGKQFVRYWLHNELLNLSNAKMSKSGENFITLRTVIERNFDPLAFRYLCLQAHYRSELQFNWDGLTAAQTGLRKVYGARPDNDPLKDDGRFAAAKEEALSALNDDLNTPQLVGILNRHGSNRLWSEFDPVLGLDFANRTTQEPEQIPVDVQDLVVRRDEARKAKEWALSDQIRDELIGLGWEVSDGLTGTSVKRRML